MEYYLSVTVYSLLFSVLSLIIWLRSEADGLWVITGIRLFIAFLLVRCAVAYLVIDTELEPRLVALNSVATCLVALASAQYLVGKLYVSPRKEEYKNISNIRAVLLTALLFMVATLLFQGIPPGFVFWDIIGSSEMSELRRQVSKSYVFGSAEYRGQGIYRKVIEVMGSLLFAYASLSFIKSRSWRKKILFAVIVVVVALIIISEGSRGKLMNAVVATVCAYTFLFRNVKLGRIIVSLSIIVSLFFLSSLVTSKSMALRDGRLTIWDFSQVIVERIVYGNAENDIYLFENVDDISLPSGVMHWLVRDFKASIPGFVAEKPLAYELYYHKTGDKEGTTYLTGTHLMKAYMDGGYLSVYFQYFFLGIIICVLDKFMRRKIELSRDDMAIIYFAVAGVFFLTLGMSFITGLAGTIVNICVLLFVSWVSMGSKKFFSLFLGGKAK